MGKTRDLLKKIKCMEGSLHAKMGLIKYRNGMDLREAEYIKKRLKEYIKELYKKNIKDPDNHDGVITRLDLRHPGVRSLVGLRKSHFEKR